jgi:hypothetical protein
MLKPWCAGAGCDSRNGQDERTDDVQHDSGEACTHAFVACVNPRAPICGESHSCVRTRIGFEFVRELCFLMLLFEGVW